MILNKIKYLIALMSITASYLTASTNKELTFIVLPKSNAPVSIEMFNDKAKPIEIEATSNDISKTYKAKSQPTWIFGKQVKDENGKNTFKIYGKTKALSSKKQLIILVKKGTNNSDGFEVFTVNNENKSFGGGKFLFVNTANTKIYGIIGTKKVILKPNKLTIIEPIPEKANKRVCYVKLFHAVNNKAKPFLSTKWPVNIATRGLIFFYNDPKSKRIRYHSIRDFL